MMDGRPSDCMIAGIPSVVFSMRYFCPTVTAKLEYNGYLGENGDMLFRLWWERPYTNLSQGIR